MRKVEVSPVLKEVIDEDGDELASAWPLCICRVVERS